MAIINSYPKATPTGSDLIIGTDVSTTPNSTKTFTIDSINELATGTPAVGTLNTLALFTSAAAVGNSSIVRSGAGATSVYTFGAGTTISNTAITTANLTTTGNTILGNAGADTLTINAASTFAADTTFAAAADIIMSNTSKILLGTTMTIEHPLNGNAIISEVGGGNLSLFSDNILEIKSGQTGENFAKFTKDGPIELYYDNVKKFSTVSAGVSVDNGGLTVQGSAGNNGSVTLAGNGVVNGTTSVKLAVGSVDKVTIASTGATFSNQVTIPATPVASTDAASKSYVDGITGYTTYVARVSQTGTNAPVATVISNNTGLTFTWTRQGVGSYRVTPSSAFVINKTWIQMTGGDLSSGTTSVSIKDISTTTATAVNVNLVNGNVADNITAAFVEIRIYP